MKHRAVGNQRTAGSHRAHLAARVGWKAGRTAREGAPLMRIRSYANRMAQRMKVNKLSINLLNLTSCAEHFRVAALTAALLGLLALEASGGETGDPKSGGAEAARAAAKAGTIAFKLTTPEELQSLLGRPEREEKQRNGDMEITVQEFGNVQAVFSRLRELAGPYTLVELKVAGTEIDIGQERPIVLRTVEDLNKLDSFWGLAGVSAARLDLEEQLSRLSNLTFDSRTVWPGQDKMPAGFDPVSLLEEGKNPGLGVRKLHTAAIDGRGVGIAIIDQPLLREHEQYRDRLVRYEAVEVGGVGPQMHGPAVASIAAGKDCGVAPGASLYYFAVPTWKWQQNEPWAELLEKIVKLNDEGKNTPKIRVVSISLGAFSERPNYARWKQAVQRAEEANILVVTCDPDFLRIGTLQRIENRPELRPADYSRGLYFSPGAALCVPAANRTLASFRGPGCYTYDRRGGMSWTVPYLAGVAALGWQIDPSIKPQEMVQLWRQTAAKTAVGPVIDPGALIEAIQKRRPGQTARSDKAAAG